MRHLRVDTMSWHGKHGKCACARNLLAKAVHLLCDLASYLLSSFPLDSQFPFADIICLRVHIGIAEKAPLHARKRCRDATKAGICNDNAGAFVVPWLRELQGHGRWGQSLLSVAHQYLRSLLLRFDSSHRVFKHDPLLVGFFGRMVRWMLVAPVKPIIVSSVTIIEPGTGTSYQHC
jgi:hypothetical protein